MLGDEAPLTIETDALDCACTDTIPYFADPKTRPRDSIKMIARHVISFIETNRLKYALTISTRVEIVNDVSPPKYRRSDYYTTIEISKTDIDREYALVCVI